MMPGPITIYECPSCAKAIYCYSIGSGNTFDAVYYSDGKMDAAMMPEYPAITECKGCKTIFWLAKAKELAEYPPGGIFHLDRPDPQEAIFLSINGYVRALSEGLATTTDDEFYLREHLWWAINDRVRAGKELLNNKEEEELWRANLEQLINMLHDENIGETIMKAELFRNLKDFRTCVALLNNVPNKGYEYIVEPMRKACAAENSLVFEL